MVATQAPKCEEHGPEAVDFDVMLSAKDIVRMFGVSRSGAYEIMHRLPLVRVGRSVRVSRRRLETWIDEQAAANVADDAA